MTLREWCRKNANVLPTHPTTECGAVSLIVEPAARDWELWHLEDYKVSSVSGVVIWLVPVLKDGAA